MNVSESQVEPEGNTKTSGMKIDKTNQMYNWFFTLRYEDMNLSQLSQTLKEIAKKFCFSGELSKDGYKHWQGCFSLKTKERFATVKNHFPNTIHLEPCKNWFKSKEYCSKMETHIEGPYTEDYVFIKTIEKLYDWQTKIRDECLLEPDDRRINWIYDYEGNSGKTQFCKYMILKHNAIYLNNGKTQDIAYALPEDPKIVLFDFCRSNEEKINYQVIESIKNGIIFSGKYESKNKIFNSPHIYIFANFRPDLNKLSKDRWYLREIENQNLNDM